MDLAVQHPDLPDVPGYSWRAVRPEDGAAIRALQAAGALRYGNAPETLTDFAPLLLRSAVSASIPKTVAQGSCG